jgi:outer membrane protein assembly factor BamB
MNLKSVVTSAMLLTVCAMTQAEDWSEFRGPNGQGHVIGKQLPEHWDVEKGITWKREIPGAGWSSPIVVAGRTYLTTAVSIGEKEDRSLRVLCLDAKTGADIWNVEVFRQEGEQAPKIHGKNGHASPTPVMHNDRLYVHFGHQGTACLDKMGTIIWKNGDIKYKPVHGNGPSPVIAGKVLVFPCDGASKPFVIALDLETGKKAWQFDRDVTAQKKFSFCTPLVIKVNGKQQIVTPGVDAVSSLDPATGKEIWRVEYTGYSVVPRPVFGNDLLYICTGFNTPSCLAIRPDGAGDVTKTHVAWTRKTGAPHTPTPLLIGERLFMVSDRGVASCLNALDGTEIWKDRLGGKYSASPIFAAGKIYIPSEEGKGMVFAAADEFELLAENDLMERSFATYAVDDDALLVRTEKHLYRIDR